MSFDSFLRTVGQQASSSQRDTFVAAETHAVDADGIYFVVPAWDNGKHVFGPAAWSGQAPTKGDPLLVLFLGGGVGQPWVLAAIQDSGTGDFEVVGGLDVGADLSVAGLTTLGSGEATLADGTGGLQIGADGSPNLGIDGDEIQARSGGAASALSLNPHGGKIVAPNLIEFPASSVLRWLANDGPNGIEQWEGSSLETMFVYRTSPNEWRFEDSAGEVLASVALSGGVMVGPSGSTASAGSVVQADFVSCRSGGPLVLSAGEADASVRKTSAPFVGGGTERVYVVSESGFEVWVSGDNWATDWAGAIQAMMIDANGSRVTFPQLYGATVSSAANVYMSSSGRIHRSTSSKRFKRDVEPMTLADARLALDLEPVTFRTRSDDPDVDTERQHVGLIAEQVATVDERLVDFADDGSPSGVQYDRIVAHLLTIVKDQERRICELETRLSKAEGD